MDNPCTICEEEDGTEEHANHGDICSTCSHTLAELDSDGELSNYEKSIQAQIDAEPEINIAEGE